MIMVRNTAIWMLRMGPGQMQLGVREKDTYNWTSISVFLTTQSLGSI